MTTAPRAASSCATVDLPDPKLPDSPTTSTGVTYRAGRPPVLMEALAGAGGSASEDIACAAMAVAPDGGGPHAVPAGGPHAMPAGVPHAVPD